MDNRIIGGVVSSKKIMEGRHVVLIAGIFSIVVLMLVALMQNLDGKLFTTSIAAIASIAAYQLGRRKK